MDPRCYTPNDEPEGGYFVGRHRFSEKDHYCIFCGAYGGPVTETNREIAKAVCNQLYYDLKGLEFGGDPMAHEDNLSVIEQALDAKDKEIQAAYERGFKEGASALPTALEEAYDLGAGEMREKSASVSDAQKHFDDAGMIRSLPLHAEQKDESPCLETPKERFCEGK